MEIGVAAYQHGIYPRSEDVVAATRGLERGRTTPEEVADAFKADREDFIRTQEEARLDYFSDGLLRWQDIFRPLVQVSRGLDARTLVRWFNNNTFYRAPEANGDGVSLVAAVPSEFEEDGAALPRPKMATLPSPFLFSRAAKSDRDRNVLMGELTREVLAPVARAISERGYRLIQLQEPWLVYFGGDEDDWDAFGHALGELRAATAGATLVLHTYFGDAGPYVDRLRRFPIDAIGVDFVQTDMGELPHELGTGLLAGVLDGRSSPMESVGGTVEFVRRLVEQVRPTRLFVSSNCELEYLSRDLAREKVLRLGEVVARLRDALS